MSGTRFNLATIFKASGLALLFPILLALGLLVGFHVAAVGWAAYRYLKVPYILTVAIVFLGLSLPLYLSSDHAPVFLTITFSSLPLVALIGLHLLFCEKKSLIEGANAEYVFAPHLLLIIAYILLPAIDVVALRGD